MFQLSKWFRDGVPKDPHFVGFRDRLRWLGKSIRINEAWLTGKYGAGVNCSFHWCDFFWDHVAIRFGPLMTPAVWPLTTNQTMNSVFFSRVLVIHIPSVATWTNNLSAATEDIWKNRQRDWSHSPVPWPGVGGSFGDESTYVSPQPQKQVVAGVFWKLYWSAAESQANVV